MRIIQVVHSFYPSIGGIENHVYELAKELAETNEVVVYTAGKARRDEHIGKVLVRRFPSLRFPFFSAVNFSPRLLWSLLWEKGDIFHSHGFGSLMPFFTSIIAKLKRRPFIFTLHGYPRQRGFRALFQKFYELFIAPVFLLLSSRIISVSTITPKQLEGWKSKMAYIPNGVSESFSCDSSFRSAKNISYIGRLDADKGIEVLIGAMSKLGKKLQLAIVGKDEDVRWKLESLASEMNVPTSFSQLPYEKVREAYCNSKAVVLPSRYEGFPLVWLEAIACSRPIFSTRVGDCEHFFSSVFGKDADKFLFSGEDELVRKLNALLKNERRFERIMYEGRKKLMEKYGWKAVARETMKQYSLLRK